MDHMRKIPTAWRRSFEAWRPWWRRRCCLRFSRGEASLSKQYSQRNGFSSWKRAGDMKLDFEIQLGNLRLGSYWIEFLWWSVTIDQLYRLSDEMWLRSGFFRGSSKVLARLRCQYDRRWTQGESAVTWWSACSLTIGHRIIETVSFFIGHVLAGRVAVLHFAGSFVDVTCWLIFSSTFHLSIIRFDANFVLIVLNDVYYRRFVTLVDLISGVLLLFVVRCFV